ncbi:hypothetical protein [Ekhidna sp.]|uniref:hypothetical protein n=1 Tax=Ekhidna sp. TaxID=2608089 RepID=UPI003517C55D
MSDQEYIELCKRKIERKFNLQASNLMERDYEYLREAILKQTRTNLSTSTLRRLWMDKYQSVPQIKTLDALAMTLDYSGWYAFKNAMSPQHSKNKKSRRTLLYLLGIGILGLAATILLMSTDRPIGEVSLEPEKFAHEGVPATIGFHYIVPNSEVEIELSWNPHERTTLDADQSFYTGTYYYPDYHQAKLIYNDRILAQSAIHITTTGWHGLIMDSGMDTRPQYVESGDFIFGDSLSIDHQLIKSLTGSSNTLYPVFTFSNKELEKLSGDDFKLVTEVKMESLSQTSDPCGFYEILIKGEGGNMRIPIVQTGCYGLVAIQCAEEIISGKQNDLSGLSTNLKLEHRVEIASKDKALEIIVGDNPPFRFKYEGQISTLKVIKFIFTGSATVSSFQLLSEQGVELKTEALYPF